MNAGWREEKSILSPNEFKPLYSSRMYIKFACEFLFIFLSQNYDFMAKNSCMINLKTVVAGLPANSEQGTPHYDTLMVHTRPAGKGIEMAMRSFLGS